MSDFSEQDGHTDQLLVSVDRLRAARDRHHAASSDSGDSDWSSDWSDDNNDSDTSNDHGPQE